MWRLNEKKSVHKHWDVNNFSFNFKKREIREKITKKKTTFLNANK